MIVSRGANARWRGFPEWSRKKDRRCATAQALGGAVAFGSFRLELKRARKSRLELDFHRPRSRSTAAPTAGNYVRSAIGTKYSRSRGMNAAAMQADVA